MVDPIDRLEATVRICQPFESMLNDGRALSRHAASVMGRLCPNRRSEAVWRRKQEDSHCLDGEKV
jgi:hypothetical protein